MTAHAEQDAWVLLERVASALQEELAQLLKARGLSPAQYNVLRILRGARPERLSCSEIAERMIARDPDITRLLDRMTRAGWVERSRGEFDRRVVRVGITGEGLMVLKGLDGEVAELHRRQFAALGKKKTTALVELLGELQ